MAAGNAIVVAVEKAVRRIEMRDGFDFGCIFRWGHGQGIEMDVDGYSLVGAGKGGSSVCLVGAES